MKTLLKNATIVNEGKQYVGSVLIDGEIISRIETDGQNDSMQTEAQQVVDAEGLFLIPGVIDDHVHFREPGLTHKADIESESRAAAAGGVTSYLDMPNVIPQTTTLEALKDKFERGAAQSRVNYSFFFGATNDNASLLGRIDSFPACGVKLFMGSSTGNMLVSQHEALKRVFSESPLPIMTHCEDSEIIAANTAIVKAQYGDDPSVLYHPMIRSAEACYRSTALAVELAVATGAQLHVAHISTQRELELFESGPLYATDGILQKQVTAEVCIPHLIFCDTDYARFGTRIKCNPAIKTAADREALKQGIITGKIDVIGTDHAPHLLAEKQGGCLKAVSGMPMVQFSLVSMLRQIDENWITLPQVVQLMCHAPAMLFGIKNRGFIREGYQADLVLIRPDSPWTLTPDAILSKCKWSPLEGQTFNWMVEQTYCNGHLVYSQGKVDDSYRGEALTFNR